MGQYYKGVILEKDFRNTYKNKTAEVILTSWDYNEGAKLIESAWIGNFYVSMWENLLADKYYGFPFVWCGDYADDMRLYLEGLNEYQFKEKYGTNPDEGEYIPYYFKGKVTKGELPKKANEYRYLINLSKKQFVDLNKLKESDCEWECHPLPLLCASGNGRGGGDYSGEDYNKVGIWAYDCIGVGNEVPDDFTELVVHFEEKW